MKDLFLGDYAVSFVDLLGQRERLKQLRYLPISAEEERIVVSKIKSVLESTLGFREIQGKCIAALVDPTVVPEDAGEHFHRIFGVRPEITSYGLSDAVVSATHLSVEETSHLPMLGVYYILLTTSELMIASLVSGYPLRGGIEAAPAVECEGEIIGPGLAEAYELESEKAEYPRVVIGNRLYTLLQRASSFYGTPDLVLNDMAWLAQQSLNLISKDSDNILFLDYFGKGSVALTGNRDMVGSWSAAMEFAESQIHLHSQAGNEKLLNRYRRLKDYLKSREGFY